MLARLGVRVTNGRLQSYRKRIAQAVANEVRDPDRVLPHQSDPAFLNALLEASEIIEIATLDTNMLSNHHTLTKLRQLVRGLEVLDPTKDDPARNYAFEFSTAALAALQHKLVGFSAGDLEVGPPAYPVECKRVSSLKRLGSSIADARAQLVAGGRAGIIALDLTAPIRAERGIAVPCHSEDAQRSMVDQELEAYLARHLEGAHLESAVDPAVLGIVIRHRLVGSVGAAHNIRTSRTWHLFTLHDGGPLDREFVAAAGFLGDMPIVEGTSNDLAAARKVIFNED